MAAYCAQECGEKQKVSLNDKRQSPGLVDSVGKRTTFLLLSAYMITNVGLDWRLTWWVMVGARKDGSEL